MTCERRNHASANDCARARANNRTSVQFQSLDTTSCAIAFFAWLVAVLRRANALFICRMREVEFNIIDIIRVTYAQNAKHPPFSIRRAGTNANDPSTHPHPHFVNRC